METFPPSYEHATARDVWVIVALKTLKRSRCWVRELTHTLRIPPALSEVFDGPKKTWLLELLEFLPRLQSLIVSGLPCFDHSSLVCLDHAGTPAPKYDLRLLLADWGPNTTSRGLINALWRFPQLVYLDLSYTAAARDGRVLAAFSQLRSLQVLKLRGIGFGDSGLQVLADAIGMRVRFLDIRNNSLNDSALEFLIQDHLLTPEEHVNWSESVERYQFEWRLLTTPFGNVLTSNSFKSNRLDEHFARQLAMPLDGRSSLDDIPRIGITHLYIGENNLTLEGLAKILQSGRLCVFDGGTVAPARKEERKGDIKPASLPGVEKLIATLSQPIARNLTYLRIHHAIVTGSAQARDDAPNAPEAMPANPLLSSAQQRNNLIKCLIARRPKITALPGHNDSDINIISFHPSSCPNLETLVLTGLPSTVFASSPILESLKRFISACADEALLSSLQARSDYSLPPAWNRTEAENQRSKSIFALKLLVLEIAPLSKKEKLGSWIPSSYHSPAHLKSSTGDRDSENLWTAAMHDFSFFGREDDELVDIERDSEDDSHPVTGTLPKSQTADSLSIISKGHAKTDTPHISTNPPEKQIDLVAALASFRKEKRMEYNELFCSIQRKEELMDKTPGQPSSSTGSAIPIYVEGHWDGEVRIVRN
ncbi:predicted protein [Uncinocarpus reesii 1704]|uniref:Leucine Rich Repeat domain protein n=1 Tax=Uncinocarpus reesii (strain UAMH 1704) TaxID=336963 RepID=C4JJZ6_UNCRE|nr:uncharacterized protein UREG_01953 [Uncinocarpus reesii 1704]EEP77104.1 predicted protein [Uncinocarpus reesii 1704]